MQSSRLRSSPNQLQKIIESWVSENIELGELDIRNITTPKDYSLLALWIITVNLEKVQTVRRMDAYYYLKARFPTITVSSQSFSRAMSNSNFCAALSESNCKTRIMSSEYRKALPLN